MIPPRLVLATGNPGKVDELAALVGEWGAVEILSLADFPGVTGPEETGTSYAENAALKARAVARATGLPALADDSGLEVEALGGAPGIRSARYAGRAASDAERVAHLLAAMADVSPAARRARFRCVVALAWPDGRAVSAEGACDGRIATVPSGAGGFGYDPVFVADDLGMTFAAAAPADKARLSHRARAVRALGARLAALRPAGGAC
jgi:XTP/dITP diphosphohydrolase